MLVHGHADNVPSAVLCAGLVAIMLWAILLAFPTFMLLSKFGLLRVDQATELAGIDNIEHGGPAYPEFVNYGSSVQGRQ